MPTLLECPGYDATDAVKPCPSCAAEILDETIRCPVCGTDLVPNGPGTLPAAPASVPAVDEPLQYSHSGRRYLLGYGRDFFGIWDRQEPSHPVWRYPRTDDGWRAAWLAFSAQEPDSAEVGIATTRWSSPSQPIETAARSPSGLATASLVLGILGLLLGILSVVALVLGYRARAAATRPGGSARDPGLATAGIVLGWVGLALWIAWLVLLASGRVENPWA